MKSRFPVLALALFLCGCATSVEIGATIPPQYDVVQESANPIESPTAANPGPVVSLRTAFGTDAGEVATSVLTLADGGYLIAGYEYDSDSSAADWDSLVVRVDGEGEPVWRKTSGRPGSDYAWAVRPAGPNQFAIVGTIEASDGTTDGYLQIVDGAGEEVEMQTYGGDQEEILWAAEAHPEGGFLLVGQTDSIGRGGLDFYVVRTDGEGRELWANAYGTPATDRAFGLAVTADGGGLIAGFTGERAAAMNLFLLRIGSDGREQWRRTIAGDRFDVAHDVIRLADGGFAVSGYSSSFGPGDHDGFLMRLTPGGRMLWMHTYGADGDDRILHVGSMPDGGFAMIGYSDWDVTVWRVAPDGELLWSHRDGSSFHTDVGKDLIVTPDGAIVAVGGTQSDNPPKDDILLLVLHEQAGP